MNLWIWRHIRVELPPAWELLQFSKRLDQGRCLFADRRAFRLELSWRDVPGPPDFARMIHDYQERLRTDYEMTEIKTLTYGDWHGLRGRIHDQVTSRYGGYLQSEKSLVEVVIPWQDHAETGVEQQLLSTIAAEPARDGLRRWRACGIDCRVAEDLDFTTCDIQPGQTQWSFTYPGETDLRLEHFARVGMLKQWFDGALGEWLRGRLPKEASEVESEESARGEHPLVQLRARLKPRFPKVTAKPWHLRAAAWICPLDNRIYSSTLIDKAAAPDPVERLSCCPAMAAGGAA